MKNILKIQIAGAVILSLVFGAFGFVADREQFLANQPSQPSGPGIVQTKSVSVSARPLGFGFVANTVFSLQGAVPVGYLISQTIGIQTGARFAESLQSPAPIPLLAEQGGEVAWAFKVQSLHMIVSMSRSTNLLSQVWYSKTSLPKFPPLSQALVPALVLALMFEIETFRPKSGKVDYLNRREAPVPDCFFQTARVLRC